MSDENVEKYQSPDYQIPYSNIIRIIWLTVRRITDEITEVKGFNLSFL